MFFNKTLFVGVQKIPLKKVDSTNSYALNMLSKSNPPEGTVVIAANQTEGKGQMGSHWLVEPDKNATFSVILYPRFLRPSQHFLLNTCISLAISDALLQLGLSDLLIKWPNDIYFRGKKLGGILIQNTVNSGSIVSTVAGIGINVNQERFPDELPNATSLAIAAQKKWDLDAIMDSIFAAIETRYLSLKQHGGTNFLQEFQSRMLGFGQVRYFADPEGRKFSGKVLGVSALGKLRLEKVEGVVEYDFKELSWL
jgi:BirA family biotin operon repressor/biotin-[acetyl-CoA-carboxylase] ligase